MRERVFPTLAAMACAAVPAILALNWWMSMPPAIVPKLRVPGMDRVPGRGYEVKRGNVVIGEHFAQGRGVPGDPAFSWPGFRGPKLDNICRQGVRLADKWPANGPRVMWDREMGEGFAAPAVYRGRVYVLDYDEARKADTLYCLSLADGRVIWQRWYKVLVKRNHGMSRTVPAVDENFVVTMGPRCHVMCVDRVSGAFRWGLDLEREFSTTVPLWYTGQCPLIDHGVAIVAPAGREVLIMGVDCMTGRIIWRAPNPKGLKMSHSSIVPMTIAGKRMYVYAAIGGIAGVSAEPGEAGKLLWLTSAYKRSVIAPSPVYLGKGRIMITAGYGAGSMLFEVIREGDGFRVEVRQIIRARQGLASEQHTPIYLDGRLFAVLPKDAGELRRQFVCCSADDLTRILWASGKTNRFGLGPFVVADGKFYIMNDDGVLTMARATARGYVQLDQRKILQGRDSWGPIAVAGSLMLLRDSRRMVCIDVGAK